MPVNSLIEFVVYVIPGFLAIEIYRAAYPVRERNEFYQIGWSILFGVIIVSFIKWIDSSYLNYYLKSEQTDSPTLPFLISILCSGLLLGIIRIYFHHFRIKLSLKYKLFASFAPDYQSIWAKINQSDNMDWAVIYLDDGAIYLGWITAYTFNPDIDNQDFLLKNAKRVDDNLKEIYAVNGSGVYLNTRDVKRIEFIKGN